MEQKFYDKNGKEIQRTKCQIYSRVVGFITPLSNFNVGKKSEFYSRKFFDEKQSINSPISDKYACPNEVKAGYDMIKNENIKVPVACNC